MSNIESNSMIIQYLTHNQEYVKKIVEPFTQQKNYLLEKEDESLKDEINSQYKEIIKRMIVEEITKKLAIPAEDVIIIIENINLEIYLK